MVWVSKQTSFNKGFQAHRNGLWYWNYRQAVTLWREPSVARTILLACDAWKKPHPCHSWWFHSTGFCRWPHTALWQPLWAGRSQQQKILSKDMSPGLPERDDCFLTASDSWYFRCYRWRTADVHKGQKHNRNCKLYTNFKKVTFNWRHLSYLCHSFVL